jgi:cell division protein FtsB
VPWLNIGLAQQIVAVLTVLATVLFALRKLTMAARIGRVSMTNEIEAISKLNAAMREELRKENEVLRTRINLLEEHVKALEAKLDASQDINQVIVKERDDLKAENYMLKRALTAEQFADVGSTGAPGAKGDKGDKGDRGDR